MQPENRWKKSRKSQSCQIVWLLAFVLVILIAATVSVVGNCLYRYVHRNECQISLFEGSNVQNQTTQNKTAQNQVGQSQTAQSQKIQNSSMQSPSTQSTSIKTPVLHSQATEYRGEQAEQQARQSAFEVDDATQIWKTETAIELFQAEYRNADGAVTVKSADGSHVIAPGTEGSYTFSLKNTSNASAEYQIWVEAELSSNMTGIPLQIRMGSDRGWLLGEKDAWEQAKSLDGVTTEETIDAGRTAEYTIYWKWPFEQGDDAADIALGDAAVNQEMSYVVTIHTLTAVADEPMEKPTVKPTEETPENDAQNPRKEVAKILDAVKTGDTSQILLWIMVLAFSAGVILCLVILKKKQHGRREEEPNIKHDTEDKTEDNTESNTRNDMRNNTKKDTGSHIESNKEKIQKSTDKYEKEK